MQEVMNERYALYNGDCVEVARQMPDESVHFGNFQPAVCKPVHLFGRSAGYGQLQERGRVLRAVRLSYPELYRY